MHLKIFLSQNILDLYICICFFECQYTNGIFSFLEWFYDNLWQQHPQWCQCSSSFQHQNIWWRGFQRAPVVVPCQHFCCLPICNLCFLHTWNMHFQDTSRDTVQSTVCTLSDSDVIHRRGARLTTPPPNSAYARTHAVTVRHWNSHWLSTSTISDYLPGN